jgi:tetratricopeptide (TPR) repeat protein
MLYNPQSVPQTSRRPVIPWPNSMRRPAHDIVCWKYLIASCTVAAAVLGVGVGGGRLLFIPATSTESNRGDDTVLSNLYLTEVDRMLARGRIEAAAVQASPVAATNAHGYREAGARASQDDIDQEMAGLDKAVEHNPRDATAFRNRAKAWEARDRPNLALADYDEATRIAPNDPTAFRDRGELWRRLGVLDLALLDLDRAIRFTFADAEIYCDRGMVWNQKGEHDRAIADFSHAVKVDPRRACAYIGRGVALLAKGEPARARTDIHEAMVIDPSLRNVVVISESNTNPQKTGGRPDAPPRHDFLRLPDERVPGIAAMINDIVAEFDSATPPSPKITVTVPASRYQVRTSTK